MKKFLIRFTAVLLAFQGAVAAQLLTLNIAQASGAPEVVINEVMWMGSNLNTTDEWIELHNSTSSPISLTGWSLENSGINTSDFSGQTIAAGGYFVISKLGV